MKTQSLVDVANVIQQKERLQMKSIPETTRVWITNSTPEHLNILNQGDDVGGQLHIENFGSFNFSVLNQGTPNAPLFICPRDSNEEEPYLISVHFGFNPDSLKKPSNSFIYRCFLVAWHAACGRIPGYVDQPVPYPLLDELRVGTPGVSS